MEKIGETAEFFDIDFHRFSISDIENFFGERVFDIVGISAVVSTAYLNTKSISKIIRKVSPRTLIVCGGNLAASSEILLRKTNVDVCVVGDGEITFNELVKNSSSEPDFYESWRSSGLFLEIAGLAFLDNENSFQFTGFRRAPEAQEITSPDFSILEKKFIF